MTIITYKAGTYPIYEDEKEITMEYVDGTNITLLSQVFSSSGYEIKEWNTSEDGTGESYKLGTTILVGEDVPTELYAIWQLSNAGRIIIKNGTEELDVSNLLLSMDAYFGKNQPFPYVVITLTKQLIDEDYWGERKKYDLSGTTYTTPPSLIQSQTIFKTNVFSVEGDWIYERIEDNGDQSYKITCVDKSYMMKSTTLEDVFYFTYDAGTYTFPYLGLTTPTKTSGNNEDIITFSKPTNFNSDIKIYADTTGTIPKLSRISGDCADIFRIISHVVRGSDYTNGFCIDAGYMYDISSDYTVKEEYTMSEIEALKNSTHKPLTGSGNKRADIVTVRANEYCWDTIKSFGLLTNRIPFFYDLAYFVDYDSNTVEDAGNIWIDWGGDDSTITDKDGTEYTNLAINNLSANEDQGSQYMRASQRVMSEGYSFTTKITDATKTTTGNDIKHMYVESTTDNTTRDFQTQLIALNALIRNYKPGDAVQFDIAETIHADKTIETLDPSEIDYVGQIFLLEDDDSLTSTYWKSITSTTFERITESEIESERQSRFSAYCIARKLVDNQNGITITNVPLAQTYIAYPSLITQYTWGEPDFMDEEGSLSSLESITQDTTLDNTADLTISDNYSAKIAVGNQKLSEIDTDKTGYTGILLEKNVDAELYRLSGYSNGVLQTYINSDGKFMSGNRSSPNRVTIDEDGLKIGDVTPVIPESQEWDSTKTYSSGDFVYYNGKAYVSKQSNNKGYTPSSTSSYWSAIDGSGNTWDNTVTYSSGDLVYYNNKTYVSLKDSNKGNTPSASSTYWKIYDTSGDTWDSTTQYSAGDFVYYNNKAYIALSSNKGNTPSTTSSYWKVVSASTDGVAKWDSTKTYAVGDAVVYEDMTWYAQSANTEKEPSTSSSYWALSTVYTSQLSGSIGTSKLSGTIITSSNNVKTTSSTGSSSSGGGVLLDSTGLKTYNSSGTLQCEIDTNGTIIAGAGAIKLDANGLTTYKTSTSTTQCKITTSGEFLSGFSGDKAYISLGSSGLTIRNKDDDVRYAQSAIHIKGADDATEWGEISGHSYLTVFLTWNSSTTYSKGDRVAGITNNYIYISKTDNNKGNSLSNTTYWTKTGLYVPDSQIFLTYHLCNVPVVQFTGENATYTYLSSYLESAGSKTNYSEICVPYNKHPWIQFNGYGDSPYEFISDVYVDKAAVILGYYTSSINAHLGTTTKYVQCGLKSGSYSAQTDSITFPFSFPNGVTYAAVSSVRSTAGAEGNDYVYNVTKSGMSFRHESTEVGIYWIAFGY